jgi:subtilisin family serine protease
MTIFTTKSLALLYALCLAGAASAQPPEFIPGIVIDEARHSYIFIFKQGVQRTEVAGHARALVAGEGGKMRHIYTTAVRGFSATLPQVTAERIARSPQVSYYERNGVAWAIGVGTNKKPTNPGGPPDTGEPPASQITPPGITRVGGPLDGSGKHAWVIDTGIDTVHQDLNVGNGANFVLRGKDTVNDGNGHGTHVAGTIAAIDNTIDVVGVAAGATVHPVRVLDNNGSGTIDGVIAGIDYVAATASTGDAANMSLGASGHFQSLHDAVINAAAAGIHFAVAAGNSSSYAMNYEPAHINAANVYTVSAIDSSDRFASFSNWGNPPIDYAAPGVDILSTKKGGGTTLLSGTSMATPHVTGLLLFAQPVIDGYASGDPDGMPDPIAHH